MIVTLVSFLAAVAAAIAGLVMIRYYTRRKTDARDSSYSVSLYGRRQLVSTSVDSLTPSPVEKANQISHETTRIIKSSFSWPEATLLHQQGKEKASSTISSASLSNSSTMEHIFEPASLTFAIRWNGITKSLFVRVINARNLLVHHRNRQPTLIDSYVRIELISTENDNTQGI
jgi:hypothetical protein